jgi:predicted enzyme related to lactoylglutathione lyase
MPHNPQLSNKTSSKGLIAMQRSAKSWNRLILVAVAAFLGATLFLSGFAFNTILTQQKDTQQMKKVTGIGGIFFKCKDPNKVREWYQTHLGLNTNQYGAVFEWRQGADTTQKGFTQWSPFKESTKYFEPSTKDFMINYRVHDLEALVQELKKNGVTIVDTIETYDYGKFVHILDIEGNKVELWEPNDTVYEQLGVHMGSKTTK